jgi:hypothetical protein
MAKAQNKTKQTTASVANFIASIKDDAQRKDAKALVALMKRATGATPRMWGPAIVGFGSYHYRYASGREGDYCATGFSPRKGTLTVYILPGLHLQADNLKKLGKHTTGKSCLYIRQLSDVNLPALEAIVRQGIRDIRKMTPNVTM